MKQSSNNLSHYYFEILIAHSHSRFREEGFVGLKANHLKKSPFAHQDWEVPIPMSPLL